MASYRLENSKELSTTIINRVEKGLQTTVLGVPGLGKSRLIADVLANLEGSNGKCIHLYVSVDSLTTRDAYSFYYALKADLQYKLTKSDIVYPIGSRIQKIQDSNNTADIQLYIINTIERLVQTGYRVIITIRSLSLFKENPTFYSSLAFIRTIDRTMITFIFSDTPKLLQSASIEKYESLYEQVVGSIMWVHLPSKQGFNNDVEYWEEFFDYQVPTSLRTFIWQQTGGHPSLTKHIIFYFSENSGTNYNLSTLLDYYTVNSKLESLLASLSEVEIDALTYISQGNLQPGYIAESILANLINYDLINRDGEQYTIKIGLLEDYLLRKEGAIPNEKGLVIPQIINENTSSNIEIKGNRVYIHNSPIEHELTKREFTVLQHLIQRQKQVVSRDELARVIWGSQVEEKFSDWSLDQTISRLRKKLGDNGYKPELLKTVRGRGFTLE